MDVNNFNFEDIYNPLSAYFNDTFANNNSNMSQTNNNVSIDTPMFFCNFCDDLFNYCCHCFIYE